MRDFAERRLHVAQKRSERGPPIPGLRLRSPHTLHPLSVHLTLPLQTLQDHRTLESRFRADGDSAELLEERLLECDEEQENVEQHELRAFFNRIHEEEAAKRSTARRNMSNMPTSTRTKIIVDSHKAQVGVRVVRGVGLLPGVLLAAGMGAVVVCHHVCVARWSLLCVCVAICHPLPLV